MIDLSGVARHLRLSVEQLRVAADLLEQGYQPGFIERYRADETGNLPRATLWLLKLEIDRQVRLQASRDRAASQLPKDAELDAEGGKFLQRATTEVEIEVALRTFRSRRQLSQNQESDKQASILLEKLIEYQGPPLDDLTAWSAEQLSIEPAAAELALQHAGRLVGMLMHSDSNLNELLRRTIQRLAQVRVELCDPTQADAAEPATDVESASGDGTSEQGSDSAQHDSAQHDSAQRDTAQQPVELDPVASALEPQATDEVASSESITSEESEGITPEKTACEAASAELLFTSADAKKSEKKLGKSTGKKKDDKSKANKPARKPVAKMTPRQRRRRWLIAMLQPMKSLKSPLSKLSSYQHLMLGRGRRSQLVKTELAYDRQRLVALARDTFVSERHPLAAWFAKMAEEALEHSLRAKSESDAVTDLEEIAADRLLVHSVDQLRQSLLQRPVRGHCILVIDAVGPKAAAVAVVGPAGDVLAIDELPCSASAGIVNQNVVRLGELVHQHRVSLVALTNGPARRFLVLSVRELMKQSADSGLRWTMADRSGSDAYAVSRSALKELASHNRRHRAAIWVARSLQDPLNELLKVDVNRLRLGSYQRELPQEPLKQLVRETIADCIFLRGIDARRANADQLQCVTGVSASQAQQIVAWAGQVDGTHSRKTLSESLSGWSEQDQRQAIGLLRVYGGQQPLDASIIHPDDYRLAERLIENTELTLPPNAPPDWTPSAGTDSKGASESASADSTNLTNPTDQAADGPAELSTTESDRSGAQNENLAAADSVVDSDDASVTDNSATENNVAVAVADAADDNSACATQESQIDDSEQATTEQVITDSETTEPIKTESDATQQTTPEPAPAGAEQGPLKSWADKSIGRAQQSAVQPEFSEEVTHASVALPDSVDVEKLARGWQVGREKLRQVASCLHAPFADPRLQNPPVPMMREMPTLGNLKSGDCVWAIVIGVADFGAFVELAPECSGLIHISRMSPHFIEDPHQAVQVGDLVMAWVVSVDEKKNRVALTALSPDQRAAVAALEAERKSEREGQRHRSSGGGGRGGSSHSGEHAGAAGPAASSGSGRGAGRSDARGGDGRRGASGGGGGGGSGGRSRGNQPGGRGDGRGRGRPAHTKTIVVTSKKPKANITAAMKEGEEPLRSFSDLMQFYESKRSDETPRE